MALARFTKVCLDAVDPALLGRFWADILHVAYQPDADDVSGTVHADEVGGTVGQASRSIVRINPVSEPKTVKHRVHLDIYTPTIDELLERGSRVVLPEGEDRRWTIMADPEGGEYCAFLRHDPPPERLHGLVVDCADPAAQAQWWAEVFGVEPVEQPTWFTLEDVPGMPFTMDFVPVPERKTVKNRVYWDVAVPELDALVDAGATVLGPAAGDLTWHLLADPEGNEFRAFEQPAIH